MASYFRPFVFCCVTLIVLSALGGAQAQGVTPGFFLDRGVERPLNWGFLIPQIVNQGQNVEMELRIALNNQIKPLRYLFVFLFTPHLWRRLRLYLVLHPSATRPFIHLSSPLELLRAPLPYHITLTLPGHTHHPGILLVAIVVWARWHKVKHCLRIFSVSQNWTMMVHWGDLINDWWVWTLRERGGHGGRALSVSA